MTSSILFAQAGNLPPVLVLGAAGIILLVILGFLAFFAKFFWLWIQCIMTGADVGLWDLAGMWFRKVDQRTIVRTKIMAVQAGLTDQEVAVKALEAHYLAGGNVMQVIRALIAARKSKIISLSFREATAIDLAGRDVLEAVQTSVYPKVIDCPPRGAPRPSLDAVAKDGIQLKVRARVTVRANLQQVIGGAMEETIIARVGEGIVSAIGSSEDHKIVLKHPDLISKAVLAKRLDSQTAFEIVSIDIADIDVGETLVLVCKQTVPKLTCVWPAPEQKAAALMPSQQNKKTLPRSKKAVRNSLSRKQIFRKRWLTHSEPATWALWTTIA